MPPRKSNQLVVKGRGRTRKATTGMARAGRVKANVPTQRRTKGKTPAKLAPPATSEPPSDGEADEEFDVVIDAVDDDLLDRDLLEDDERRRMAVQNDRGRSGVSPQNQEGSPLGASSNQADRERRGRLRARVPERGCLTGDGRGGSERWTPPSHLPVFDESKSLEEFIAAFDDAARYYG